MKRFFLDKLGLHIDSFTANRYRLIKRFLISGEIKSLNVGTGGGVETIQLFSRGNFVTTIEIDKTVSDRTRQRILRNGYGLRHTEIVGHFLKVDIPGIYSEILMCEVLEHIKQDDEAIGKLASLLEKDGRLILSTPTALYGQMPGDVIATEEDQSNPDYHVRVGYQGIELDKMLLKHGFVTLKRVYNGYLFSQYYHQLERNFRKIKALYPLYFIIALLGRIIIPFLELFRIEPSDQITIAIKL